MKLYLKKLFYLLALVVTLTSCNTKAPSKSQKPRVVVSVAPYKYFIDRISGDALEVVVLVPSNVNPHIFEPELRVIETASTAKLWFQIGESFEAKIARALSIPKIDLTQGIELIHDHSHCGHHVVLVPSNVNPHIFEPELRVIETASTAKLWFQIGESFEAKIARALSIPKIDLTQGIELIHDHSHCGHHHDHTSYDVHLWLSPKNGLRHVDLIEKTLSETFPTLQENFHKNAEALREELKNLDQEIAEILKPLPYKTILVSHPAFAYFCHDYGLSQVSIEQEGKEPSLKHIIQLSELPREELPACILIQAQHDAKGALRLSKTLKIPAILVDPYSEDYITSLRQLAEIIRHPETP